MPNWPHSPPHRSIEPGTYMVTCGTYNKVPYFSKPDRFDYLTEKLFEHARRYEWELQAWSVMANHYHFIGFSRKSDALGDFISSLHTETARYVNSLDQMQNRKVWYQYWDSHITYQKSYYARLKYVHNNPVYHGIVPVSENYTWCSAGWFNMHGESAFKRTVESFKIDGLKIPDEF